MTMTTQLTVHTLGQFAILVNGRPLAGLSSRTAEALLVYLMYHPQPLSRQVLADFLWDERSPDRAAANLRTLLTMMRKVLGHYLLIDRYHVGFNHARSYWLDARELEERLATLAPAVQSPAPLTAADAAALQAAVDLYQGSFLAGFYLSESRGFDEWSTLTQERLRHQVEVGLRRLVTYFVDNGLYEVGRPYTARLLALDPYYEAGHRQMMWLLARSGQRNAALSHYQQCRRLLTEELGVEPSPATTAVYNQIRALEFPPPCQLPPQTGPFVGRETELALLSQQLAQPDCRLLSLLGPGGTGKTRLAIEVAAQLWQQRPGQFLHGFHFIPLETIATISQIPLLLAEKLNIALRGSGEPVAQLLGYLHDKESLLILDNAEHLLDQDPAELARLLARLLQEAPQIKLLITSRHRLNLREEWVFDLAGLDYPPDDWGESEALMPETYSALTLFLHHARRVRRDFAPTADDREAISQLCQLLEGLPLGLELAAAGVRRASCRQIVAEIKQRPERLSSSYFNIVDRHRSLTAVFDYSWNLLEQQEQRILPQLTIFRGTFTIDDAAAITGAAPDTLHSLADKSLLRLAGDGQYDLHTLLRQLSAAHLDPEAAAATAAAHAEYYAALIQAQETRLDGPQAELLLVNLQQARPNLQAAWEWGRRHQTAALLDQMVGGLAYLDDIQGLFLAGYESCAAVSGSWLDATEAGQRLAGRCRAYQARFAHQLGRLEEADALFQASIDRLRPLAAHSPAATSALALALTYWGELARHQGELATAHARQAESLALFRDLGEDQGIARVLLHQANLAFVSGQLHEAVRQYEEGLAVSQALGSYRQTGIFLDNLGAVLIDLGEYDAAEKALKAARERRRAINDRWGLATSNNNLGVLAGLSGDYGEAEKRYQAAVAAYRQLGYMFGVARCLSNLGSMLISQGQLEAAQEYLAEALAIWQTLGSLEGEADALFYLGRAANQRAQYAEAERLFRQSAALYRQLDQAISLMQALADLSVVCGRLGQEQQARTALGESLDLAETAAVTPGLLRAIMAGADLLARQGEWATAALWFDLALRHPQTTQPVRDEAARLRQSWPKITPAAGEMISLTAAVASLKQKLAA
jgi:DNA-binding SARP family transcriptional activator/predicted ATPase/TolA-binding protein